ncbi:MHCK/EF2 kinase [Metarhizium rileyi]|uniref:MHCK/EF2 kinase n=1 Tax=Metarhizium rileyi (strain RCEF 4871) TaxID=1649241 RepID=A0A166XKA7_METRR|nr:MHCK/EF2 kinase [Metarhizium rileyi RCEF 4871]
MDTTLTPQLLSSPTAADSTTPARLPFPTQPWRRLLYKVLFAGSPKESIVQALVGAVDKALEIVNKFNQLGVINKLIKINVPEVWSFNEDSSSNWSGQNVLCEPFIQNYQKFNSNTGWNDESKAWGEVMQALSHFSYHLSGGYFVLCDIQGGIYQHEIVLSDPVILSRDRQYGVTDLGPDGISSFFAQHNCNKFCRPHWARPANPKQYFRPVQGTAMIKRTATCKSITPSFGLYQFRIINVKNGAVMQSDQAETCNGNVSVDIFIILFILRNHERPSVTKLVTSGLIPLGYDSESLTDPFE